MDTLTSLRSLELTDDEVRSVLARYPRRRRPVRAVALAFALAALVAVAVPQSRAELEDALLAALHGGPLPGKPVPPSELPPWSFAVGGEPRVIAEAAGERMHVHRTASGSLCFDFGFHAGICGFSEQDLFGDGPVALFGPTRSDPDVTFRLWGLTLATVAEVEVRFADGGSVRKPASGAFGIALPADSEPEKLVAYGADGRVLTTLDLTERWKLRPAL